MIRIIDSLRIKSMVKIKRLNINVIVSLQSNKPYFFFSSLVLTSSSHILKIKKYIYKKVARHYGFIHHNENLNIIKI